MEMIAFASIAYLAVQLLVALINLVSGQKLKAGELKVSPMVSILVPARNEENNIGLLLDDISRLDYGNYELLVYDDDSVDQTASIVREKARQDDRIRYIHGKGPLPGWLGKNHACHQLARIAKGDYLLFMDADVRVIPELLTDSLAAMEKHDLDLLSLFPVQKMRGPGEWLTVPLMNRILLGNLPLILVRLSSLPAFSAANGQFMLFKSDIYKKHWLHKQVNNEKVEDIRISRNMKKMNYRVQTLLSGGQISCRMYKGFGEGLEGFAKNIHAFFGKNWLILLLYILLTTLGPLAVWISFSLSASIIYLAAAVIFRLLVSVQSLQSWWINTLLMPLQQITLIIISVLAAYSHFTGTLYWKGRKI